MNGQINRATQLWKNWEEKEKMLLEVFGHGQLSENLNKQRYDFLSRGIDRISKDVTPDEKLVLGLIKKSTRRLEKELYPHPLLRIVRRIKALVYDKPVQAARLKNMKAENILSLNQSLSRLGFNAEKLDLEKLLDFERPDIQVRLSAPYGMDQNFSVQLQLEKDASGQYQVQGYTGTLQDPLDPVNNRSFQFDSGMDINMREAVNLLQGRAVMKHFQIGENRMGSKWIQLDFNRFTLDGKPSLKETGADYEYNLHQELSKIAGALDKPELASVHVLNGMERGNRIALKQVSGTTNYLEADPLGKSVAIRDAEGKPTSLKNILEKHRKEQELKPEMKLAKSRTKTQNQSQSIGMA